MIYKDKNKQNILIKDKDGWFKQQMIDQGFEYCSDYYWWYDDCCWETGRLLDRCTCDNCRPSDWASIEDEMTYKKVEAREKRFQRIFGEYNKIGDYVNRSIS